MFYKHWKKIALALTGFFWVSCDSDSTSANGAEGPSSSSVSTPASSSSVDQAQASSSSETTGASSSSFEQIMPAYGVPDDTIMSSSSNDSLVEAQPLYGVTEIRYVCEQAEGDSTMTCGDGATCKQLTEERWGGLPCTGDICPEYGVVQISENTYECDGKIYNEAEFRARYTKEIKVEDPEQDSTFMQQPVLYGPPCVFNGSCDDEKE